MLSPAKLANKKISKISKISKMNIGKIGNIGNISNIWKIGSFNSIRVEHNRISACSSCLFLCGMHPLFIDLFMGGVQM
jgi:hypothetical protein